MKKMLRLTFTLTLVFFWNMLLSPACEAKDARVETGKYQHAIATARSVMWNAILSGNGTGVTIAMTAKGKLVYAEGIGVADREHNRLVDVETRFNIGSTSKMFAAVAILLLAEDGKLRLDDSVAKFIPEFTMKDPRYKDITVRMLFNHSSGLPGSTIYFGYETDTNMHRYLLDTLAESSLKHAPGAMAIYCNDGFTLAEIVVERVSGKKFVEFLGERVFKPLGMKHSGPSIGELKHPNTAQHYDPKTGKKHPAEVIMVYAAGGLSSTASDLCRFANSFSRYGKRILSDASIAEILKTQPTGFAKALKGVPFCSEFGWDYSTLPDLEKRGVKVFAKSGGSQYFTTYIQTIPEAGITVAFSISGRGATHEALSRPILDALMQDEGLLEPRTPPVEKPIEAQVIPLELTRFAGYYTNGGSVVRIIFDKDRKKVDVFPVGGPAGTGAAPLMTLVYHEGVFVQNDNGQKLYFTTIDGGSCLVLHQIPLYGVDMVAFQKVEELKEPKALKVAMEGTTWLVRNFPAYILTDSVRLLRSSLYSELPGYVDFSGLLKVEDPDQASIAATAFRDQAALRLFEKNGQTWAKSGPILFTNGEAAKKVVTGTNRVTIGPDGFNEWLKVEKGAALTCTGPEHGRVIILAGEATLYDSITDSGERYVPEGGFVYCAGKPGDAFAIKAR